MIRKRILTLIVAGMITTSIFAGCSVSKTETSDGSGDISLSSKEKEEEKENVVDENINGDIERKEVTDNNNKEQTPVEKKKEPASVSKPEPNTTQNKPSTNVNKPSTNVNKPASPKPNDVPQVEAPTESTGDYLARVEDEIFNTTNAERQKNGLAPLKRNSTANKYARSKSLEMLDLNYFDHNSPKNGYIQDIAKRDGWKYSRIGENIYTMSSGRASSINGSAITNSWMNSEGHRRNILNKEYTDIGIGVTYRNGKLYATQVFYTP